MISVSKARSTCRAQGTVPAAAAASSCATAVLSFQRVVTSVEIMQDIAAAVNSINKSDRTAFAVRFICLLGAIIEACNKFKTFVGGKQEQARKKAEPSYRLIGDTIQRFGDEGDGFVCGLLRFLFSVFLSCGSFVVFCFLCFLFLAFFFASFFFFSSCLFFFCFKARAYEISQFLIRLRCKES